MDAARRAVTDLIRDGRYDDLHAGLIPLFGHEGVDHRDGLTLAGTLFGWRERGL